MARSPGATTSARLARAVTCAVALLACTAATAANGLLSPDAKLGSQVQELPFPGVGRLIFGFVITVAVAVAAVFVLRRFWPALASRRAVGTRMRVLDRAVVSTTLTVSLLEVDGSRFVVAEGRGGVGVTPVLDAARSNAASGS